MSALPSPTMTADEYLAYDAVQPGRHEFYNGDVVAMAGASEAHALVTANLTGALRNRLAGQGGRVYSADLRVHVSDTEAFVYPDLCVVCGPSELLPTTPVTLVNPRVVVEVLSESTAAHDRGPKAAHYRRLPALGAYMLVSIEERRVEVYYRGEDGVWRLAEAQGDGVVEVPPLGLALPLTEFWAGLEELAPGPV